MERQTNTATVVLPSSHLVSVSSSLPGPFYYSIFFTLIFFFSYLFIFFVSLSQNTNSQRQTRSVFFFSPSVGKEGKTHARRYTDAVESDDTPESCQYGEKKPQTEFHSFVMSSMWRDIASASITSETQNNRNKRRKRREKNNSKWRKRSE